tara:strand:- start:1078 stop:1464 length:387 start_codon:yes stop_codon:yes gene_type:complete
MKYDILSIILDSSNNNTKNLNNNEGSFDISQSLEIKNSTTNIPIGANIRLGKNIPNGENIKESFSKDNLEDKSRNNTNIIDLLISLLYLILITVLIVYSILLKNTSYLIALLILTLVYILYKIINSHL